MKRFIFMASLLILGMLLPASAADKKILLIAGARSHGPGEHEFNAGCLLLKKSLDGFPGIQVTVQLNGWPTDEKVFEGVHAIVLYMDGGAGHPALQGDRLQKMDALMK